LYTLHLGHRMKPAALQVGQRRYTRLPSDLTLFFFPSQKSQSSHPAPPHASHATPSSLEQATKMDGRNVKGKWQAARTASWRRRARSLTSVSSTTTGGAVCSASAAAASSLGTEAQPILPVLLARRRASFGSQHTCSYSKPSLKIRFGRWCSGKGSHLPSLSLRVWVC